MPIHPRVMDFSWADYLYSKNSSPPSLLPWVPNDVYLFDTSKEAGEFQGNLSCFFIVHAYRKYSIEPVMDIDFDDNQRERA